MATDGPDPVPASLKFLSKADPIFMTHTIPSNAMERWVVKVREASGQEVDWSFVGGRAVVRYIGDRDKVIDAITALLEEHNELQRKHGDGLHTGDYRWL